LEDDEHAEPDQQDGVVPVERELGRRVADEGSDEDDAADEAEDETGRRSMSVSETDRGRGPTSATVTATAPGESPLMCRA
jgi:hypothetical protein